MRVFKKLLCNHKWTDLTKPDKKTGLLPMSSIVKVRCQKCGKLTEKEKMDL